VAIIGMGCMFPKAEDLAAFWANIRHRRDAITEVPASHWRPEDYYDADPKAPDHTYARRGGFLDPVDFAPLDFGIAPNNLDAIDTTQLLGLMVARQALEDAGYGETSTKALDRGRVSVVLGVTGTLELVIPLGARLGHPIWRRALKAAGVPEDTAEDVVKRIADSYVGWQENSFPGLLGNVAAGRIANRLDLGGTNCVIDAACASSFGALNLAILELAAGRCDLALSGGLDTFNDIFMYMCFSKTPALSRLGDARPFDAGCDGTILGEGLGVLALKRLDDARRDGDKVYAVIRSIGSSSDGKGNAVYAPKAEGQARALRQAYDLAGISPATVELVEAHGTGTKVGDAVELAALNEVYRGAKASGTWCALGSVKSQIGHTKAAAGAAGVIKAALALHHKVLPPTIKVTQPVEGLGPGKSPFYANTEARPWLARTGHPRRAAVSAFGFGGSNFHCLLEEAEASTGAIDWDGETQILAFSAGRREALVDALDAWPRDLAWSGLRAEAARSRARFQPGDSHRLVLVATRETDLDALFRKARAALNSPEGARKTSRDGVFVGSGPATGRLAMLFPGQGSQYVGMLRELACVFPQVQDALAAADALDGDALARLSDRIYPFPAFNDADRASNEQGLRATDVAQPAIGAVSLGLLRVLEHFGVRPDAVGGHSFGELTALCAAGRIDAPAFALLARERGRLMADQPGGGSMLAVFAPIDVIEEVVRDERLDLVVANKNGPRQFVLSGQVDALERAERAFQVRQVSTRALAVSAAFHGPAVSGASEPFLESLKAVAFAKSATPVYANATAGVYPDSSDEARALLAGQIARPVEFVAEIEAMARAGVGVFLEVGPDAKLTGLVRSIVEGGPARAIAVDASRGERGNLADLASALAELAAIGYPVLLTRWDEGVDQRPKPARKAGLTVKVSGANVAPKAFPEPSRAPSPSQVATTTSALAPKSTPVAHPPMTPTPLSRTRPSAPPATNGDLAHPQIRNGRSHEHAAGASTNGTPASGTPPLVPIGSSDPGLVAQALRTAQDNLVVLQKLSEQTADLHRQFLDGQDKAQRTFQSLLEQQQRLTLASLGLGSVVPAPVRQVEPEPIVSRPQPAPAPARQAPEPPPAVRPAETGHTQSVLLEVVAEKTGYPAEMLELDMQLDADLGIDSIKRVEILSALQERLPDAPIIKPEHLGTLRTLRDIVGFLSERQDELPTGPTHEADAVRTVLLEVVAEKTGYPAEMLELDMQLDADLGIDSIKRVEILSALQERLPDAPIIKPEHLGTLRTLKDIVGFLAGSGGVVAVATVPMRAQAKVVPVTDTSVQRWVVRSVPLDGAEVPDAPMIRQGGEVWVLGDDSGLAEALVSRLGRRGFAARRVGWNEVETAKAPDRLDGLVLVAPESGEGDRLVLDAFRWLRLAGPGLRRAGKESGALAVTITRLDGSFGFRGLSGAVDPTRGGLAGVVKTAGHEWPEVRCKAIDVDPELDDAAGAVLHELFQAGPVEVGLTRDGRSTLELKAESIGSEGRTAPLERGDVVLITGGARGVTAEVATALARVFQPTLVLFGRSPSPRDEPDWLLPLQGEAEIKRALASRANGQATPQLIGDQFHKLSANREILQNLERIEAAGAKVVYRQVDVRDENAVRSAVAAVRGEFGPVRGLVHGAGVLADRRIDDQTDAQFAEVYSTKVSGLRALLGAVEGDDLRALVLFSSSTARFGRSGQVAYAAANEVMNKWAQREAIRRPGCRVVSVNWGPWDGGMVTPSLKPLFEAEGVAVIPLAAGADYLVEELQAPAPDRAVEVVVLGAGSDLARIAPRIEAEPVAAPPVEPASASTFTTVFERPFDPESMPILKSHVIDGRAVAPMALILELLAQAALQRNPGLIFFGVDDLRLLKGIVHHDDRPESIAVLVGKAVRDGSTYRVPVELRGRKDSGQSVNHARAEVLLVDRLPHPGRSSIATAGLPAYDRSPRAVYHDVLFHGPDLHGLERIDACGPDGIVASARTAPAPSAWLDRPLRQAWLSDPLALDCAFQLMVLWSSEQAGSPSLPTKLGRYRQFRRAFPSPRVQVAIRPGRPSALHAVADIEFLDADGALVARIEGYECVSNPSLHQAFRRNRLPRVARSAR
jgi:acyl transferase domain-containing protein